MEITTQQRKNIISAARGVLKADVVFRNGWYLNVFTNRFEKGDVAIKDGYIVGVDDYEGDQEIDVSGKILCPGFIDGHIHIESSMLAPSEFSKPSSRTLMRSQMLPEKKASALCWKEAKAYRWMYFICCRPACRLLP